MQSACPAGVLWTANCIIIWQTWHPFCASARWSFRRVVWPNNCTLPPFPSTSQRQEFELKVSFSVLRQFIRQDDVDQPQAGAIVVKGTGRRRRILLVTNKEKDRWIFPKGTVKKKETSEQA